MEQYYLILDMLSCLECNKDSGSIILCIIIPLFVWFLIILFVSNSTDKDEKNIRLHK